MKPLLIGIALLAAVVVAAIVWRALAQRQVAARLAIAAATGIDEAGFVRIGDIDQWVSIRGEDRANPLLVIVHGGPGGALLPFAYDAVRPWEKAFTVVQWDQRGAGRTYSHGRPRGQGELSIARMSGDGVEVVRHALARTGQRKAILLGLSWGSILGVDMARRRPDLFHAYVGAGQVADIARNEAVGYDLLLARVRAAGDARAEARLVAIGPPPYRGMKPMLAERKILRGFPPASERGLEGRMMRHLATAPGLGLKQARDYLAAQMFSFKALGPALLAYRDPGGAFAVPVVFIQGDQDIQTPTVLVEAYARAIDAPGARVILIPGGGHSAMIAMPEAFGAALVREVRPLAVAGEPAAAR